MGDSNRILVIEDERPVADALSYALNAEGFDVTVALDGDEGLERYQETDPSLIILDLMLPGISGWDLMREFRKGPHVPVIMLTARAEEADRVAGLEMGADDYVTKPFSVRELTARVRAVLRRGSSPGEEKVPPVLSAAGVTVDRGRHEARVDGELVELAPKEFDTLAYLREAQGRVRSRDEILEAVWGQKEYIDHRTVDVHIRWLRKKIEKDPSCPTRILTVRGVGYRFAEER